jgi:hypothetical protein
VVVEKVGNELKELDESESDRDVMLEGVGDDLELLLPILIDFIL